MTNCIVSLVTRRWDSYWGMSRAAKGCARISFYISGAPPPISFIFLVRSTSSGWNLNSMGNHCESVLSLWSAPPVATAQGFITPSSPSSVWGLWPPLPGVMDSFLVPFIFVEHARVDVPTLYPALHDASRLALWTVGNRPSSVNTRSFVLDYRWSSCPCGAALWYCTLSWVARSVRPVFEKLWPHLHPLCSYFSVVWRALLLPLPMRQIRLHGTASHPPLASHCLQLAPYCQVLTAGTTTAEWLSSLGGSPRLLHPLHDLLYGRNSLRLPQLMV